jgi:Protein of unknown function (DUF3617)
MSVVGPCARAGWNFAARSDRITHSAEACMRAITIILSVLCLPLSFGSAAALDLPPRNPGQWELAVRQIVPADPEVVTTRICLDAASDRKFMEMGLSISRESCSKFETSRQGDTFIIDAVCQFGGMKSATRTVITGNYTKQYEMRITGTTEGGPGQPPGPQASEMVQTGKLVSPTCLPGFKPGDMELPGGMKVNINAMGKPPGKKS